MNYHFKLRFPAYSFTIVNAPVEALNAVKDEIEDALAAALDVDLEDVCAAFVPHKDNCILKCNLADSPGLKEKLNNVNVDDLVRDALMADPKIKDSIGDQSCKQYKQKQNINKFTIKI